MQGENPAATAGLKIPAVQAAMLPDRREAVIQGLPVRGAAVREAAEAILQVAVITALPDPLVLHILHLLPEDLQDHLTPAVVHGLQVLPVHLTPVAVAHTPQDLPPQVVVPGLHRPPPLHLQVVTEGKPELTSNS
jgi:hypothetical protein